MTLRHPAAPGLESVGCLKLQVIFLKKATNHRALLRKMTHKDMDSTPPCSPGA